MGTYVIGDVHGCYDEFQAMLGKIGFADRDRLIMTGDYIDRGRKSFEMLKWMERCPPNVCLIRGNHEEEFLLNIELMALLDKKEELGSDFSSNKDTMSLYETVKYFLKDRGNDISFFDFYGTIGELLACHGVTMEDLRRWANIIRKMPYYYKCLARDRPCIAVHGGYAENEEAALQTRSSLKEYYLYARSDSLSGGREHGMIVAGHTPTVIEGEFCFNRGNVYRYYDREKDCIFYNIDCGCAMRMKHPDAKLACIRLEDEKIFYL